MKIRTSAKSPSPAMVRPGTYHSLWEYLWRTFEARELVAGLARARIVGRHASRRLGQVWHYLEPLLQVGIYVLVFGVGLRAGRGMDDFVSFLAVGQISYSFSSRSIMGATSAIDGNRGLLKSFTFPRLVLPASAVLHSLMVLNRSMLSVGLVLVIVQRQLPRWAWLWFPAVIALHALFNVGWGALAARLADRVPDVQNVLQQVFRLMFFVSLVLFPVSTFENRGPVGDLLVGLLPLNPLYCFIHLARRSLISYPSPQFDMIILSSVVWTVVGLLLGGWVFYRGESTYGAARVGR